MTTIKVKMKMCMGMYFLEGDNFFTLATADQKDFLSEFEKELEDKDKGIPANVRNDWKDDEFSADIDGGIAESVISTALDDALKAYSAPQAEFQLDTSDSIEMIYIWSEGKLICYRKYKSKRSISGGTFDNWEYTKTYSGTKITASVCIDFSWAAIY